MNQDLFLFEWIYSIEYSQKYFTYLLYLFCISLFN